MTTRPGSEWLPSLATLAAAASALALSVPSRGAERTSTTVKEEDCVFVTATPRVPLENVDYLVPQPFRSEITTEPDPTNPGRLLVPLNVGASHCKEVTVGDGEPQETTWAVFGVFLNTPVDDRFGDGRHPEKSLHVDDYRFWYASDNPEFVELLRREGGENPTDAVYVEDLYFNFDERAGTFELRAPQPTPSPFSIEGEVSGPPIGPFELTAHHYSTTPRGWTLSVEPPGGGADAISGVRLRTAQGELFVEQGSQLDRVLCDDVSRGPEGGVPFGPDPTGVVSFNREKPGLFSFELDTSKRGFNTRRARCAREARR